MPQAPHRNLRIIPAETSSSRSRPAPDLMRIFLWGKDGVTSSRYDAETKARAVRLVRDHAGGFEPEWAAITAVSGWLGMSAETLRK